MPPSMIWGRRRGLNDAVLVFEGVFRPARDDNPELSPRQTSRRSDTSSPIRIFCLPACSGSSSGSMTISTRSRCGAKPLRGRAARLALSEAGRLSSSAWMAPSPVWISSKTKAACSSSSDVAPSFSERRPNLAPLQRLEDRGQARDPLLGTRIQGFEIGNFTLKNLSACRFPRPWPAPWL